MTSPLSSGMKLGPYEVVAPLGAGGMGEVWRARDPRLGRDVAIKALPPALAQDPERLARFEREARLLATLSHSGIAGIFAVEEVAGARYLVLELVEGETLAQRLARGALPVDDAIETCRQIAAAVEAAHEAGVIHRDLKPGNVMLKADGTVKVLDFGLARGPESRGGDSGALSDLSQSPTRTSPATIAGVILGTAAYMSPEQARGRPVDKRADIWSFGCVLYECLSGRHAFDGETVSDTIASILKTEPDWSALPAATPAHVRALLARCLRKDPRERLRDIGDARLALAEPPGEAAAVASAAPTPMRRTLLIGAIALLAGGAFGWFGSQAANPPVHEPARVLDLDLPRDMVFTRAYLLYDASAVALVGRPRPESGKVPEPTRIFLRRFDDPTLKPLAGTEGVEDFVLSSDGHWIYLVAPISPGAPQYHVLRAPTDGASPPTNVGLAVAEWNSVVTLPNGDFVGIAPGRHMLEVANESDGRVTRTVHLDPALGPATVQLDYAPVLDARHALVTTVSYGVRGYQFSVGAIDVQTGKFTRLVEDGGHAQWTADGRLLFVRGSTLLAAHFDRQALKLTDTPVPVVDGLLTRLRQEPGNAYVARDVAMFQPGGIAGEERRIGILDPDGKVTPLSTERHYFEGLSKPSQSATKFVVGFPNTQAVDEVWAGDMNQPGLRRIVAIPNADASRPVLSPDARTVAFVRTGQNEQDGLYLVDSDGLTPPRRIAEVPRALGRVQPYTWSPDNRRLYCILTHADGTPEIEWLDVGNGSAASPLRRLVPNFPQTGDPDLSADGHWIAFTATESGREESYVAPLAADGTAGPPVRITSGGSAFPNWLPDGHHIAVTDPTQHLWSIPVTLGTAAVAGAPTLLHDLGALHVLPMAALPNGRFLCILLGEDEASQVSRLRVVTGWQELLAHASGATP